MAQEEKSIIRVLTAPTIELDEFSVADQFTGTNESGSTSPNQMQKQAGNYYPLIKINNYIFDDQELIKMRLYNTDFLPTISLQVRLLKSTIFLAKAFPKDGDIVSVYIRGRNDIYKPIRNDYVINSVSTSNSIDQTGSGMVINISGELSIPGMNYEVFSVINNTSYEALATIAEELGLGFASNETHTEDSQKWLATGMTHKSFIQHITEHSWKDGDSHFITYVDIYYNLNFVNLGNQFSESGIIEDGLLDDFVMNDDMDGQTIPMGMGKKLFTNHVDFNNSNMYVKRWNPINNSSNISKKWGYKMYSNFYEHETGEVWKIYSEPIMREGAGSDTILLRGRAGDNSHRENIKYKWQGIQYSDNVHDKYKFSKVHNNMNNIELEKLKMSIEIRRANFNIYRSERIPCILFDDNGDVYKLAVSRTEEEIEEGNLPKSQGMVIDRFYTGFYIISGMVFKYDKFKGDEERYMSEDVILTRKEWPIP